MAGHGGHGERDSDSSVTVTVVPAAGKRPAPGGPPGPPRPSRRFDVSADPVLDEPARSVRAKYRYRTERPNHLGVVAQ